MSSQTRIICSWAFVVQVRILHSFVQWCIFFSSCPQYSKESSLIPKFKRVNTLPILIFQSPTFAYIECHRQYHCLHDSDLHRQRYITAFKYLFEDLCGCSTKCISAVYFLILIIPLPLMFIWNILRIFPLFHPYPQCRKGAWVSAANRPVPLEFTYMRQLNNQSFMVY